MKDISKKLQPILEWYAHGTYFPLKKIQELKNSIEIGSTDIPEKILAALEFYASEGLSKQDPIRLLAAKENKSSEDKKQSLMLILSQVSEMRKNEVPRKEMKQYEKLKSIPSQERTAKQNQRLNSLAQSFLK